MSRKKSALVILSGGQDSTTCLYWAKNQPYKKIHSITFEYAQRHIVEVDAARNIAAHAQVDSHEIVNVSHVLKSTSPLISNAKLSKYDDKKPTETVEKTFVPMRNQLFLTVAFNRAQMLNCANIVLGVCEQDYGGYPDWRRYFINAIREASIISLGARHDAFEIHTPLMYSTKAEAVRMAVQLRGCYYALGFSHTAYDGKYPPNGDDHASELRRLGFLQSGIPDPLVLRAVTDGAMGLPDTPNYNKARQLLSRGETSYSSLCDEILKGIK